MTEPSVLDQRARALRALAEEVEDVAGPPLRRALEPVWQCPHAEQVRDALRTQRGQARTAAERLRETARRLEVLADQIREQRAAEARRREAEAQAAREAAAKAAASARSTP